MIIIIKNEQYEKHLKYTLRIHIMLKSEVVMQFVAFKVIKLPEIDKKDMTFSFSTFYDLPALCESVLSYGILQPLWVQETADKKYRIISGFKRYLAATKIGLKYMPALIIASEEQDLDLFLKCIQENKFKRVLNTIEISNIIHKLLYVFCVKKEIVISNYLSVLGLGKNEQLINFYAPLRDLQNEVQSAIICDEISIEMASLLFIASQQDRLFYLNFIRKLHLSKSNQREFWSLARDVSLQQKKSVKEILLADSINEVLQNVKITSSQKVEKIKHILMEMRYPRYSATVLGFEKIIQTAKMPPGIQIRPTPYFSGEEFYVNFIFCNLEEYEEKLEILHDLFKNGLVEKMIHLI